MPRSLKVDHNFIVETAKFLKQGFTINEIAKKLRASEMTILKAKKEAILLSLDIGQDRFSVREKELEENAKKVIKKIMNGKTLIESAKEVGVAYNFAYEVRQAMLRKGIDIPRPYKKRISKKQKSEDVLSQPRQKSGYYIRMFEPTIPRKDLIQNDKNTNFHITANHWLTQYQPTTN